MARSRLNADLPHLASTPLPTQTSDASYPRESTVSLRSEHSGTQPFSSIGALFAAGYDSSEDDVDTLPASLIRKTKGSRQRGETFTRVPIQIIQEEERASCEAEIGVGVIRGGSQIPATPERVHRCTEWGGAPGLPVFPKSVVTKDSYAQHLASLQAVLPPWQRPSLSSSLSFDPLPPYTSTRDQPSTPATSSGPRYPAPTQPTLLSPHHPSPKISTTASVPSTPAISPRVQLTPNSTSTSVFYTFPQRDSPGSWSTCPSSTSSAYTPITPTSFPLLPPPHTPISPYLAAPSIPLAHLASNDSSGSSDSIRGLKMMQEKKAMFRGGEEELMSPFSPRAMLKLQLGLHGAGGAERMGFVRRMTVLFSGTAEEGKREVDFWKRMSTSVRLDQAANSSEAGESEWLVGERRRNRMVKYGILTGVFVIAVVIAAILVSQVLGNRASSPSDTSSPAI